MSGSYVVRNNQYSGIPKSMKLMITRISIIADDSVEDDDRYDAALNAALEEILGHTMSTRSGDTLLKMQAIPLSKAHMDMSAVNAEVEQIQEVQQ